MNPETLNTLQTEHRCLLGQAEEIGAQLERIRNGCDPEYALLNDRVRFLKEHYIEVHCPKDKALIQKLLGDTGNLGAIMTPFLNAHETNFLKALGELEADLQAVLGEHIVLREDLLQHGDTALYHLREQIVTEETGPLPWARRRLAAQDWLDIGRANGTATRHRQEVDCSKVGILFPDVTRQVSPEIASREAARDPHEILSFPHKDQHEGH